MLDVSETDFGAWVANILAIIQKVSLEYLFCKGNLHMHVSFVLHAIWAWHTLTLKKKSFHILILLKGIS